MALPVIESIRARGKLPIIVGGSGLYLKFLTHGPGNIPAPALGLRAQLETLSLDELNARLLEVDPVTAANIDHNNPRYVKRALEISLSGGDPASVRRSSFQAQRDALRGILLTWDPSDLDQRIRRRTSEMLGRNAAEELAALPAPGPAVSRAIGVPQIQRLLDGAIDRSTCEEEIVIATRQYAKRQRTWFRREGWLTSIPGGCSSREIIAAAYKLLTG